MRLRDDALCAGIVVIAFLVGLIYLSTARRAGVPAYFYQSHFGPAVMAACGRGFVNPVVTPSSRLASFLEQSTPELPCNQLDRDIPQIPLTPFQTTTTYLLRAAAGVWWVAGVSWRSLDFIAAVFFSATLALGYGVFRLILPRWLAAALTFLWMISPLHLFHLVHLRDYAKAVFFLATILVIATIVLRPLRPRALLSMSVSLGVALGVGFGVRADVVMNLVPFIATVMLFTPGSVLRNLRIKTAAVALCVAAFAACAWPVLKFYRSDHALWHVAILGLTAPFDQPLGVMPARYSFGNSYSDDLVIATVTSYAKRTEPLLPAPALYTPRYVDVTRHYFLELLRRFQPTSPFGRGHRSSRS